MGDIIATTGPDLMSGNNENVTSTYDGTVMLASKNLLPDPGLRDYDETRKKHPYWDLLAPPRPTHWGVFAKDSGKDATIHNLSRQNIVPIPLAEGKYELTDSLIAGPSPMDKEYTAYIPPPAEVRYNVFQAGINVGYPAGWYRVAYAWIAGVDVATTQFMTQRSPLSEPFELSQGNGIRLDLTGIEVPENATGICILLTAPAQTLQAASNQTVVYPQVRYGAQDMPDTPKLKGPFYGKGQRNPTDDGTKIDIGDMFDIGHWQQLSNFTHAGNIRVRLTYRVVTRSGVSKKYNYSNLIQVPAGKKALRFKPKGLSPLAIGWQPLVQFDIEGNTTEWFNIVKKGGSSNSSYFGREESAEVHATSPSRWSKSAHTELKQSISNNVVKPTTAQGGKIPADSSGDDDDDGDEKLEAPGEAPTTPIPVLMNNSALVEGVHSIATCLMVGEQEGPLSTVVKQMIQMGEGIRLFKPLFHNRMENAEGNEKGEIDPKTNQIDFNIPAGWIFHRNEYPGSGANAAWASMPEYGLVRFIDKTGPTNEFNAFTTPRAVLHDDLRRYTLRFLGRMWDYTAGKCRIILDEYNVNDVRIAETQIKSYFYNGEDVNLVRMSKLTEDTANPSVIKLQSATTHVRVRVRAMGNGKAGAVNYRIEFRNWGVFEGWGEPRAVDRLGRFEEDIVPRDEIPQDAYPHGGYCKIVKEKGAEAPNMRENVTFSSFGYEAGETPPLFQGFYSDANRATSAAISGAKGFRMEKVSGDGTGLRRHRLPNVPAAEYTAHLAFDIEFKQFTANSITIAYMSQTVSTSLDYWQLVLRGATGNLELVVYNTSGAVVSTQMVARGIEPGDAMSIEIGTIGTNTATGQIVVYTGSVLGKAQRYERIRVNNLDYRAWAESVMMPMIGVRTDETNTMSYRFNVDNVTATRDKETIDTAEDTYGNYFEYYGPVNTPMGNEKFGPTGMRIPVTGGQWYTLSAYVSGLDMTNGTGVLRMVAKDAQHNELNIYPLLASGLKGDMKWKRYTLSVYVPVGAAYIEFFSNRLAAGTVRIHGIQFEKGQSATKYTDRNERNGWFDVTFSAGTPDILDQYDPAAYLNTMRKLNDIVVAGVNDPTTSYTVKYAWGNTKNTIGAYTTNLESVPAGFSFYRVRVDITSGSVWESPDIRSIHLDVVRPVGTLCRADGTEFAGGVVVRGISAPMPTRRVENIEYASGAQGFSTYGSGTPLVWFNDIELEVFRSSTATEISDLYGYLDGTFVLEFEDYRYTVRFNEKPSFTARSKSTINRGAGLEPFKSHIADGLTAYVVGVENRAIR